jgi:RND family efflux transporter MFP subunit
VAVPLVPSLGATALVAGSIAGAAAGGAWFALAGFFRAYRGLNETISSLLLSYIAIAVFNHLVEGPLRDPASLNKPSTRPVDEALRIDPDRADLHLAMGAMYRGLGDRHLALRHLELACRASPESWEVHLLLGRTLAERARQVESSGALSAQQIAQYQTAAQTAQARLASAQARVQSAQAQLQSQDLRLRMTQVHAPDDGVISARAATVGAVVPAGQELFRLVRGNRLEWRAEVTATELERLAPKQTVRVLPASGGEIAGTVRTIGPVVDAQTRNALVYVDLPAGSAARAGMFARGEFRLGGSTALVVPQQAIVVRDGFSYVFRVEGGRAVQQKVRTGRRDGERIEVLEGLKPEAALVARGAGFLNDGDVVQVVDAAAAGGMK